MRKSLAICSLLLLAPLAFGTEHSHAATKGGAHSNAPAKAHSASSDRDKGKARAADAGKGKKKGLKRFFPKHNHGNK
jgi:Ni/Co efflux regulator RcnB